MTNDAKNAIVGILFRVEARPGQHEELKKFLLWDREESMKDERGTLRFDIFQDPMTQHAFYVYEAYEDLAAFREHQAHAPFLKWESQEFKRDVVLPHVVLEQVVK